jgi:hypothetical protein
VNPARSIVAGRCRVAAAAGAYPQLRRRRTCRHHGEVALDALPDREAGREGDVRVIDESGEDYMDPSDLFVAVKLPAAVVRAPS